MVWNVLKNIALFLFVFGVINDDFVVDRIAGENALKIIFVFFFLVNIKEFLQDILKPKNSTMKLFYLFFFTLAVVTFVDVVLGLVALNKALMVLVPIIVTFVYVSYYDSFEKLLYFIWVSMVFSAIVAVFSDPITQWTFRKTGGTGDPNEFAAQLLVTIGITIYLFMKNKNQLFLWSSLLLFAYTLVYAGSKSSFLTLGILVIFTMLTKFSDLLKKMFSLKVFVALLIVLGGLSYFNVMQSAAVKGIEKRAQSSGTAKTRFVSWNAGVRMSEENFLTGVGVENYEKNVKRYATDFIAEGSYAPHNFLIKIIAESGIFPFIAMLLFLILLFTSEYKSIVTSEYFWIYLSALSVVLMGLTLSMSYEKYFWLFLGLLSHVNLLFWMKHQEEFRIENNAYIA